MSPAEPTAQAPRGLRLPTLALAGATLAVSFSAILIRIARDDPATIVWLRMGMATAVLAPWALREARRGMRVPNLRRRSTVVLSGVLLAGHFLFWTASLRYTSIAASVLLVSLHPLIVTPLGHRLHGDRVPPRAAAGMVLALLGTAVTCAGDVRVSTTALLGDALALGGAVSLAGYLLIGRSVRAGVGVASYSGAVYATVCVVAAIVAAAGGSAHLPSPRVALICAALAVVCTIGGHTVYNWALRHVRAATVSVAFLGEPPLTALLGALLLASIPSPATLAGGVLILAGVGVTIIEPSAARRPAAVALE
jgi:drug/metabolite transporter (DMT)-like permease